MHRHQFILENVRRSIPLDPDQERFFLSLLSERVYTKKSQILSPGDICREQNYVVKGCLKVYYLNEEGEEHIVKFAIEDWWAFDIESFYQLTPAFYGIGCLEETTVLQLNKENHDLVLKRIPAFEKFYRLMLQNSFIALQHRMTQSLALTAQQKYERFQQKYPGLENRISQKSVAAYLGITPVFLSVIRKDDLIKTLK
jgi:CRP-like cAMP-binding protein